MSTTIVFQRGGLSVFGSTHPPDEYSGGVDILLGSPVLSGSVIIGFESASTGLRASIPGSSYSSPWSGLLCAQLDREVVFVACLATGDDIVEPGPDPDVLYMPSALDEAKADAGDGAHDDSLRIVVALDRPCEKPLLGSVRGDGHADELRCGWPSYSWNTALSPVSSLGEAAIGCPPPLHAWASAGPGYAGVGGTTLAPNTCPSYPVTPPGPAGLGSPGVTAPGLRRLRFWSLSLSWARAAAARASASSCLSFFRLVKKMIMHAIHASVMAPAMLDVITPILALNDSSSSSSSVLPWSSSSSSSLCARAVDVVYDDVDVGVGVIVVENVSTFVPIVVVIVLVTMSPSFPSASHWASDTLRGVLVSEHDCCMVLYTSLIVSALPVLPRHLAESSTKSPLLPQRQSFISDTVLSEEQPEVLTACVRHDCAEAGYAEKSTSTEARVGEVSRRT